MCFDRGPFSAGWKYFNGTCKLNLPPASIGEEEMGLDPFSTICLYGGRIMAGDNHANCE